MTTHADSFTDVRPADFTSRDVPIYSTDGGAKWRWERPVCTGKKVTT